MFLFFLRSTVWKVQPAVLSRGLNMLRFAVMYGRVFFSFFFFEELNHVEAEDLRVTLMSSKSWPAAHRYDFQLIKAVGKAASAAPNENFMKVGGWGGRRGVKVDWDNALTLRFEQIK